MTFELAQIIRYRLLKPPGVSTYLGACITSFQAVKQSTKKSKHMPYMKVAASSVLFVSVMTQPSAGL